MRGRITAVTDSSAGAGGAEYGDLTPGAGEEWTILECVGYHDDNAAARDTFWTICIGGTTYYRSTVSIAQLLRQDLMSTVCGTSVIGDSVKGGPFVLHHGDYIRFNVSALGAGKKAYLNATVLKVYGVPEHA